ncbi:PIG-L deacetylase family protein [Halodesulfovibrio aestuarii]|uniref:PIG-L deacetylase family protein n=1 Tax=Halodesulfovibrio aestuarii TaxID=126333 RepID=UPI00042087FE
MSVVLVVAPHADDESLGCGGTIARHLQAGDEVYWLLVTMISTEAGYADVAVEKRAAEIKAVAKCYGMSGVHQLKLPPAQLDTLSKGTIVRKISKYFQKIKPEIIYTAYRNDAHSDHEIVYDAVMSAAKQFRAPYVRRILAYETLSETEFCLKPESAAFRPNVFFDISLFLERKIEALTIFSSELQDFPFPRSLEAVRALAMLRGTQAGVSAAEAFMLLKEIN